MKHPAICKPSFLVRNGAVLLVAVTFFAVASAGQAQVLGYDVATDGGFTVAGAPFSDVQATDSGVVRVYDSSTGALLHTILNPSPAESDFFGSFVAISGTLMVVGVKP